MTICASCRRTLLTRLSQPSSTTQLFPRQWPARIPSIPRRSITSTSATPSAAPSISQPYSAPEIAPQNTLPAAAADTADSANLPPTMKRAPSLQTTPSSCQVGTVLKGLSYLKGVPDPVAKEDDEYPDWLWSILAAKNAGADGVVGKSGLAEMTRKQRAKYERKQEKLRASLPRQIPLHEQSIDLTGPGATAEESLARRQELTRSQREARRKAIREKNFLKTM